MSLVDEHDELTELASKLQAPIVHENLQLTAIRPQNDGALKFSPGDLIRVQDAPLGTDDEHPMDLFSAGGGTQIAAMLEGLAQSDEGRALLEKFTRKKTVTE